ncbi:MAG: hypothetical protein AAF399_12185 [Bacteroidota bacterium]
MFRTTKIAPFLLSAVIGLLISVGSSQVSAQIASQSEDARKGFVGLAVGASYALGNFGDGDVNNADAGYAQNGR